MKRLLIIIFVYLPMIAKTHAQSVGVIFDCDGVLVDSERVKYEAWRQAVERYGIALSQHEYSIYAGSTGKETQHNIEGKYKNNAGRWKKCHL